MPIRNTRSASAAALTGDPSAQKNTNKNIICAATVGPRMKEETPIYCPPYPKESLQGIQ